MATFASASETDSLTSPGVYIKTGATYVVAKPLVGMQSLDYDYGRHIMTLPAVSGSEKTIDVVVFAEDFTPTWSDVQLRTVESPAAGIRLSAVQVKSLGEHKFQLTYELPARDQHFMLFDIGCCTNSVYGVALTDVKKAIKTAFSNDSLNAVSTEYTLASILKGAPEDKELLALHQHWQTQIEQQEASRHFELVRSAWQTYQEAPDPTSKVAALTRVKNLSETYMGQYPEGNDSASVKNYLDQATEKLKI